MSAISATSASSTSISMHGTSTSPAEVAARQRRSPAMIIQRPVEVGLTSNGSSTPFSWIDEVSSVRSPISVRG
jgi:hypothetical protein